MPRSAARIQGAVHREKTPCFGTLQLGSGRPQAHGACTGHLTLLTVLVLLLPA
ncbi:hypothetical protein [Streptomyces collinus]